jgi:hypothetical protein
MSAGGYFFVPASPSDIAVIPAIQLDLVCQRLQAEEWGNIVGFCGVTGIVGPYQKAGGSFRGERSYTADAHPARIDRWFAQGGQRSFILAPMTSGRLQMRPVKL